VPRVLYAIAVPYLVLQRVRQAAVAARRANRTWRHLAWSALAGVVHAAMLAGAATLVVVVWQLGWLAAPMAAVAIAPLATEWVLRFIAVPAGLHRLAYHAARFTRSGADPRAFALCMAARAAGDLTAVAWVEAQRDTRTPLGDAEIAATGLVAATRGDAKTARAMLRSIAMIVENHPAVRELAGEWLACDAAERGAWGELVDDAAHHRWPATPLTYLLEGIAARHLEAAGAPGPYELWARWALAPRRRATRRLVAEALAAPAGPAATGAAAPVEASPIATALGRAVAAHLAFESQPAVARDLALAVQAWDAALGDPATRSWLAQRALELDAPAGTVERAVTDVAGAVTDELARRAEAAQLGAPPGGDGLVGAALSRRLRHGRLDALEAAFARWGERRLDQVPHPAIDEWREFVALRAAYLAAATAGGLELRRLAFPRAFTNGSNVAAWLWNKRQEYALSHAISRWLLAEAILVGDSEAIELGHRNCALAVPTRLGHIQP